VKTLIATLRAAFAAEVAQITTCLRITRRDSQQFHYAANSRDLVFAGKTWSARGADDTTAITNSLRDSVGNVDMDGFFESAQHRTDLRSGLYDNARVEIFQVDRANLPATVTPETTLWLFTGYTGQAIVKPDGHGYSIEARSLIQLLQQNIGTLTSGICRAEFGSLTGDEPCLVNPAGYTATAAVESVSMNRLLKTPALTQAVSWFSAGRLTWLTGGNAGAVEYVAQYAPGFVVLLRPGVAAIQAGDTFSIVAGCDHTLGTCAAKFNNAINFQGEPFLPGLDPVFARSVL